MESAVDEVRPGTTWDVEIRVTDRGEHAELLIDGSRVAEGREVPDEPRRTVTVARDTAAGRDYIRIVNATTDPIDVDLSAVLASLGTKPAAAADAEMTVLRGDDPYAGQHGEDSPTTPRTLPVNLSSGVYDAPAWSFSVIVLD